ncbi:MAG: radical SAM protein [Smithella sp.]|nr:radical SAM protein [Smithella sp.]
MIPPKNKSPLVIPVFIMNSGCKHRCSFCNQKITAGNYPEKIIKDYFDSEVHACLSRNKDKSKKVEIAFFGGNFTGVDAAYQENLLSWAKAFIEKGLVDSIKISTRPDYISEEQLSLLRKYKVKTVEIGGESFVDCVLQNAERGHSAADIEQAVTILKNNGFRTGLHLMAGLPGDTHQGFMYSIDKTIELKPHTVRIHPVLVLRGTKLAEEFKAGHYEPLQLADAVALCKMAWEKLSYAGIRIIRMGVQTTPEMETEGAIVAGPVHPALGTLVLSSVYLDCVNKMLDQIPRNAKSLRFTLAERDISNFRGLSNSNVTAIKKLYPEANLIIESCPGQPRGIISLSVDSGKSFCLKIPGIT